MSPAQGICTLNLCLSTASRLDEYRQSAHDKYSIVYRQFSDSKPNSCCAWLQIVFQHAHYISSKRLSIALWSQQPQQDLQAVLCHKFMVPGGEPFLAVISENRAVYAMGTLDSKFSDCGRMCSTDLWVSTVTTTDHDAVSFTFQIKKVGSSAQRWLNTTEQNPFTDMIALKANLCNVA